MISAKEMRRVTLRNKTSPEGWDIISPIITKAAEEGEFKIAIEKTEEDLIKAVRSCRYRFELLGYRVAENSWEIRVEW